MHPILFEIGGISIHAYGLLGAVGFLTVAFMTLRRAKTIGVTSDTLADLIFWTSIVALVGARVVYVAQNFDQMDTVKDMVNLRAGGLVFYGSLLFGIPLGSWYMRRRKMPFLATWDVFATAMPIGHAITRVGCLMAGCCFGLPSDVPWAVTFTNPDSVAPLNIAMHPVQLYEAGWLLFVGLIVNLAWTRKKFDGQIMALYLLFYAAGRWVIELYRGDAERGFFLPDLLGSLLSYSQGISLIMALVAIALFAYGKRQSGSKTNTVQADGPPPAA